MPSQEGDFRNLAKERAWGPENKTVECKAKTTPSELGLITVWKCNYDVSWGEKIALGNMLAPIYRAQRTCSDLGQSRKFLPFFGSGFFAETLSAAASLSFHRLICSCLIL